MQHFQPLGLQVDDEQADSGHISTWPVDPGHVPTSHRIATNCQNDWNGLSRGHYRLWNDPAAAGEDDCDLAVDKIGS